MEVDNAVRFTRGVYATLELQGVTGLTRIALKDSGDNPETLPSGGDPDTRIPIKPSLIDRLSDAGEDTIKETRELVLRLNQLLDKNNIHQMKQILINVESATGRFTTLEDSADRALAQVPALAADARRALSEVNELADEFKQLSRQMRQELTALSQQSGELMQTGASSVTGVPWVADIAIGPRSCLTGEPWLEPMLQAETVAINVVAIKPRDRLIALP